MKLWAVLLIASLSGGVWLVAGPARLGADYFPVLQVFDGDTIEVDMAGYPEKVRFIGVNTPETHHPSIGRQCYGKEASRFLSEKLEGRKVRLVSDEKSTNRDRYDRLLRYVYTENGEMMNLALVRGGYGFASHSFRYSMGRQFADAEHHAIRNNLGLWGKCQVTLKNGYFSTQVVAP